MYISLSMVIPSPIHPPFIHITVKITVKNSQPGLLTSVHVAPVAVHLYGYLWRAALWTQVLVVRSHLDDQGAQQVMRRLLMLDHPDVDHRPAGRSSHRLAYRVRFCRHTMFWKYPLFMVLPLSFTALIHYRRTTGCCSFRVPNDRWR